METTRTGGNVTLGMCVCYLNAVVAHGDSSHVSTVYRNFTGTCLRPEVLHAYLRVVAGILWESFFFFQSES